MVRLKDKDPDNWKNRQAVFQFHYGSVKREQYDQAKRGSAGFQFHYGSVKRIKQASGMVELKDFNSTMVRLKVYQ